MRLIKIQHGTQWHDARRIDLRVRDVIVPLDVIQIDGFRDAGLLIQIKKVAVQIWIIRNAPEIAFEMEMINRIEANQRAEQPPIRFHNSISKKITARGQSLFQFVESSEQ